MRGPLLLLALLLGCSTLYPAPPTPPRCLTACGASFDGTDCAGFVQLEQRTVRAFDACDAGSSETACEQLNGWVIHVLPASATFAADSGLRYWRPGAAEAGQAALEHVTAIRGETDCYATPPSITLSDEAWSEGSAAVELIHAATRECSGNPYPAWASNGRACVRARVQASYRDGGR